MGAHYIQDLTQPFHTTVMPGENAVTLLGVGLLDKIGVHGPSETIVQEASDQHLALEQRVNCEIVTALKNNNNDQPLVRALRQNTKQSWPFSVTYVRDILTLESHNYSDTVAQAMREIPPLANGQSRSCNEILSTKTQVLFTSLMVNFGKHTRSWLRSVLAAGQI